MILAILFKYTHPEKKTTSLEDAFNADCRLQIAQKYVTTKSLERTMRAGE